MEDSGRELVGEHFKGRGRGGLGAMTDTSNRRRKQRERRKGNRRLRKDLDAHGLLKIKKLKQGKEGVYYFIVRQYRKSNEMKRKKVKKRGEKCFKEPLG